MDLGLRDKVAVITGGSVGIGLGVARAFAREGAHVLIAARDRDRAEEAAAGIAAGLRRRRRGPRLRRRHRRGLRQPDRGGRAGFGGADILVNNAGTGSNETILEAPDEKWQAYWDLHVMAAVRLARGLAPLMEARGGGAILNNASICATQPLWYEPIYNVTKAALLMLSKNMATEFIPMDIRVNTINPGLILTPDWIKTAKQLSAGPAATGRATCSRSPTSTPRSSASAPSRSSPTSSSSSAPTAPPTPSAPPTSSTAACSAPSEEGRRCPFRCR